MDLNLDVTDMCYFYYHAQPINKEMDTLLTQIYDIVQTST